MTLGSFTDTTNGNATLRPGRNIAQFVSPGQTVAFGDTYDNGVSVSMDNIFTTLSSSSTSLLGPRHGGRFNFCFVDGHVHNILLVAATSTNGGGVNIALPSNPAQALYWCADPNFIPSQSVAPNFVSAYGPDPTNGFTSSNYPLQSGTETCAQAVQDLYNTSTVNP